MFVGQRRNVIIVIIAGRGRAKSEAELQIDATRVADRMIGMWD
jgi:hypothetical protein